MNAPGDVRHRVRLGYPDLVQQGQGPLGCTDFGK